MIMISHNLLPKEYIQRANYERLSRFFTILHIYVASVITIGTVLLLPSYFFLTYEEEGVRSQIEVAKKGVEVQRVEEVESKIRKINEKFALVATHPFPPVPEYLDTITGRIPEGVTLTSFAYAKDEQAIKLVGKALERDQFLQFLDNLKTEKTFLSIDSPISNLLKESDLTFTITISTGKAEPTGRPSNARVQK